MEFVLVKAGTFQMGSNSGYSDEKPIHTVNITKDYYIGKYEVTNEEVVKVFNQAKKVVSGLSFSSTTVTYGGNELLDLDEGDCQIALANDTLYVRDSKGKYPVVGITWYGASAFAEFLNTLLGTDKYRLPTEAEWEFAARGGKQSNGYTYSGSNTISDVAWYSSNSGGKTHPVGTKSPNELGIYDMSGNVWEWCSDWYSSGYYSSSLSTDPTGPTSGSVRVLRGGSWYYGAGYCRVAFRCSSYPSSSGYNDGFRIVYVHN